MKQYQPGELVVTADLLMAKAMHLAEVIRTRGLAATPERREEIAKESVRRQKQVLGNRDVEKVASNLTWDDLKYFFLSDLEHCRQILEGEA